MARYIFLVLVGSVASIRAADPIDDRRAILRDAGLSLEAVAIIRYFAELPGESDRPSQIPALIRKLGADDYAEREEAQTSLQRLGTRAIPPLREALKDPDYEIVRRVEILLRRVKPLNAVRTIQAAADELISADRSAGLKALFNCLDRRPNSDTFREVLEAAIRPGIQSSARIDEQLQRRLRSTSEIERAWIVRLLGTCDRIPASALVDHLKDASSMVRFETAYALSARGDPRGPAELLRLLTDGKLEDAYRAEETLVRIYRNQPRGKCLTAGDPVRRAAVRATWEDRLKESDGKPGFSGLASRPAPHGRILIAEIDNGLDYGTGRIWECGPDGAMRWEMNGLFGAIDVDVLPGGRYLVTESNGRRVAERDRDGEIVWKHVTPKDPRSARRLPNGNIVVATENEVYEVDREQNRRNSFPRGNSSINRAIVDDMGTVHVLMYDRIVTLDEKWKPAVTIRFPQEISYSSLDRTPTGSFLYTGYRKVRSVFEIDGTTAGKSLWSYDLPPTKSPSMPVSAVRMTNGHTLITAGDSPFVVEVDTDGKTVRRIETKYRPFFAMRY